MSDHPTPAVVLVPMKSMGIAVVLAFFFGPIGMLYSTIVGAITMFVLNIAALLLTAGLGLIVTWPIGMVWAALAAISHNKRALSGTTAAQVDTTPALRSTSTQAETTLLDGGPSYRSESTTSVPAGMPLDKRSVALGAGFAVVVLVVGFFAYQRIVSSRSSETSSASAPRMNVATLTPNQSVLSRQTEATLRSSDGTFRGAWFHIWAPPNFEVIPSIKSATAQEGYDSAFFRSPDRQVEFYVFAPQWNGEPTDIALAPNEKQTASETKTSAANIVSWYSIQAIDGSYIRTYQDTRSKDGSVRSVVGLKYTSKAAYDTYRADYARFKNSFTQFAD